MQEKMKRATESKTMGGEEWVEEHKKSQKRMEPQDHERKRRKDIKSVGGKGSRERGGIRRRV